jgi:hypothetical protein
MTHQFLKFAAVGAIFALTAATTPILADEMVQHLGPVGPNEPILTAVGTKRVIAFYTPGSGSCTLQTVTWDQGDAEAASVARYQVSLNPGQTARIDSSPNQSLTLRCGAYAQSLAIVDPEQRFASTE